MKKIDLTGRRFGRLEVISESPRELNRPIRWLCKCDCGNIKSIKSNHLVAGLINSCGCLRNELNLARSISHGMYGTRIYCIWGKMIARCKNLNDKDYGGRGITVCEKWHKFEGFYEDMKETYQDNLTIDRINNDGNYEKDNCRWATKEIQANNTRMNHYLTVNEGIYTLADICKKFNLNYKNTHKKLKKGIPIEQILKIS